MCAQLPLAATAASPSPPRPAPLYGTCCSSRLRHVSEMLASGWFTSIIRTESGDVLDWSIRCITSAMNNTRALLVSHSLSLTRKSPTHRVTAIPVMLGLCSLPRQPSGLRIATRLVQLSHCVFYLTARWSGCLGGWVAGPCSRPQEPDTHFRHRADRLQNAGSEVIHSSDVGVLQGTAVGPPRFEILLHHTMLNVIFCMFYGYCCYGGETRSFI